MHHKLSGLAKKYQSWKINSGKYRHFLSSKFIFFYWFLYEKNVIFFLYLLLPTRPEKNFFCEHLSYCLKDISSNISWQWQKRKKSWISCHRVRERKKICNQSSDWYFDTAPGDKIAIKVCFANSLIWSTSALHVKVLHPHSHIVWLFQRNVAL